MLASLVQWLQPPKIELQPVRSFTEAKCEAAIKIQRMWRRCNSAMAILNDDTLMRSLDHAQMKQLISLLNKQKIERINNPVYQRRYLEAAVKAIYSRRECYIKSPFFPVFSVPGNLAEGKLPECVMMDASKAENNVLHNNVHVLRLNIDAFRKMPFNSPTKEGLDRIVKALAGHPAFPWEYIDNGCLARSKLAIAFLKAMNIPKESISLCFAIAPDLMSYDNDGREHNWSYHVAPCVKDAEAKEWIIDPAFFPDRAVSWRQWADAQRNPPVHCYSYYHIPTVKTVMINLLSLKILQIANDRWVSAMCDLESADKVLVRFDEDRLSTLEIDYRHVHEYRLELEKNMLLGPGFKFEDDDYLDL